MSIYQTPTLHNATLNTVFNPTDFSQKNTNPYLPITGGQLTGTLNVNGSLSASVLTTSTYVNLPSTYSSAPSGNQLGTVTTQALSTNPASTVTSMGQLTLSNPGTYLLLLNVYLTPTGGIINNYIVSIGDSATAVHDMTSAVQCMAPNGASGSILCVQVSKIVTNTTTKSYKAFGTVTLSAGTVAISSTNSSLTAIRIA